MCGYYAREHIRDSLFLEDATVALAELTALENAYKALQPLGQEAQRRALRWLTDALTPSHILPGTPAQPNTTTPETAAPARRRRNAATAARTPTNVASSPSASRDRPVKGSAPQATAAEQRPYRRMPDPNTIMKAYRKVGTVTGLADRFDVPRHTVNHWARRLRAQGYDIGRPN